ncbi:Uncharacterised protein [Klebsiella variicola]|nr:Uncharacterised protein [Klebsiella variicola]
MTGPMRWLMLQLLDDADDDIWVDLEIAKELEG